MKRYNGAAAGDVSYLLQSMLNDKNSSNAVRVQYFEPLRV